MAGIYIHIPFCKQACFYCDFHFSTSLKRKEEMINAIANEMQLQAHRLNQQVIDTIYFGGGTPSLLDSEEVRFLLNEIAKLFSVNPQAEITLEANPDDLSGPKLNALFEAGINRLSIGIQSFRDQDLKFMNRAHNAEEAMLCIAAAKNAGFENISIDLIYGIPGLSMNEWKSNLEIVSNYQIQHISAYALTVEENTAYHHHIKDGIHPAPKDEEALEQFQFMIDYLKSKGYEQYEISNFSFPEKHSQHNSGYWKKKTYLGLGPSAHSYFGDKRQWNIANNALYLKKIANNEAWFEEETLTLVDQYNEYIMTGMRTKWGCDLTHIETQFGNRFTLYFQSSIDKYIKEDMVVENSGLYSLTEKGKFLADGISSDLFYV